MYMDYDMLEEAALLTLEYIDAVRGQGKEYFGLKVSFTFKLFDVEGAPNWQKTRGFF